MECDGMRWNALVLTHEFVVDVRGLQRKSCLWFLGKAFQFLHHLHSVTHEYYCTCCTQGFVFAPLFRG